MISWLPKEIKGTLAFKILFYIIFLSSILTLFATAFQLYIDYNNDAQKIFNNLDHIRQNRLKSITLSLYNYNIEQLDIQFNDLLTLEGIAYLEVIDPGGLEKSYGHLPPSRKIVRWIPLEYRSSSDRHISLGKLKIVASLEAPYRRLVERFYIILISNLIKVIIASIFIFILIQYLITRHLSAIAHYTSNLDMEKLETPLVLKRKRILFSEEDEFDQLTSAVNGMRLRLRQFLNERIEFEQELIRSEKRLRQLADATWEAIAIHDKGKVLHANNQFYTMFGYTPQEMLGVNVIPMLLTRNSAAHARKQIEQNGSGPYEVRGKKKDGTEFPLDIRAKRMDYHGKRARVAVFRDISDYKKAQEDMAKLRNYLKNMIDAMPSVIAGMDCDGRITQWNLEAEKKTGIPKNKAMGKMAEEMLFHTGINKKILSASISSASSGKLKKNSRIPVIKNGQTIFYDIHTYPLTDGIKGAVIRLDNVTEQVKMEEMMVQSEKMMSVGGLAAGMAHEINNPLGIIMGMTQTIIRRFSLDFKKNKAVAEDIGLDLKKVEQYMIERDIKKSLDGIMEGGNRAAKIVRDMLDFSRKSESVRARCDLHDLLDKAVELASSDYDLKKKFDFRSIRIERQYNAEPPMAYVMETEIEQVFLNLLRNAAQAMSDKDYKDETPQIILKTILEKDQIHIELEDNGPGMDKNTRKRIFEPFFTTKAVGKGTGLGLSVSYFIITNTHNGEIFVESVPNVGTKFIIHLPV